MSSSNRPPVDQAPMLCIPEAHFKEIVDYYHITPVHYYDYGKVCLHQEVFDRFQCATTCRAELNERDDTFLSVLGAMFILVVAHIVLAEIKRKYFGGDE